MSSRRVNAGSKKLIVDALMAVSVPMTMKEFIVFKNNWLDQIMIDHTLAASARVVAYWIIRHFNRKTGKCCPGLERIAKLSGLSKGTVFNAVALLEANGHFEPDYGSQGRGHSTQYNPILKDQPIDEEKVNPLTVSRHVTAALRNEKRSAFESEKVNFPPRKGQPTEQNTKKNNKRNNKGALARTDEEKIDDEERYERLAMNLSGEVYHERKRGLIDKAKYKTLNNQIRKVETLVGVGHIDHEEGLRRLEGIQIARVLEQWKKRLEEELSGWIANGLVTEREAHEIWTDLGDLLDGYASGECTREQLDDIYGRFRSAILKRHPFQQTPPQTPANGCPEVSEPIASPTTATPPERLASGSPEGSKPIVVPHPSAPPGRPGVVLADALSPGKLLSEPRSPTGGHYKQDPPSGGEAVCSPEGSKPVAQPSIAMPLPEATDTVTNIIPIASPPTVPTPPARSVSEKPRTFREEKERLIYVQRPIHEAYAKGAIGEAEYERRIAETEAAAREDSTRLKAVFNPQQPKGEFFECVTTTTTTTIPPRER